MIKTIPTSMMDVFITKINNLNKKLIKFGKPTLTYTELNKFIKSECIHYHTNGDLYANDKYVNISVEYVNIDITGFDFFKKDDHQYEYLGTINTDHGIKTIYCIDDKNVEYFKKDINMCDHCHIDRKRHTYYVFNDMSINKVLYIGSTCAKDFFGYDVDKTLSIYIQTFFKFVEDDELDDYKIKSSVYTFNTLYNITKCYTNNFKFWVSGKKANEQNEISTSNKIINALNEDKVYSNDNEQDKLNMIREYWNNQSTDNSFNVNICEALKFDYAVNKNVGIYAYGIFAAINHINKTNVDENHNICKYQIGDKPTLDLVVDKTEHYTIENHYSWNNSYKTMYKLILKSADNVTYVINTASGAFSNIKVGDKIKLTGTICNESKYDQNKTTLKYCKIISIDTPPPSPAVKIEQNINWNKDLSILG